MAIIGFRRCGSSAPESVIALVVPDAEVAFKILALNTEKAHNLKEKSLETIRMLRALADEQRRPQTEREFAFEFDAAGVPDARRRLRRACPSERRRVSFAAAPHRRLPRREAAERLEGALAPRRPLLAIDDQVGGIVDKLKKRGFTSPYLRPFVIARINPIRFSTSYGIRLRRRARADAEERGEIQRRADPAGRRRSRRRWSDRRRRVDSKRAQ